MLAISIAMLSTNWHKGSSPEELTLNATVAVAAALCYAIMLWHGVRLL